MRLHSSFKNTKPTYAVDVHSPRSLEIFKVQKRAIRILAGNGCC